VRGRADPPDRAGSGFSAAELYRDQNGRGYRGCSSGSSLVLIVVEGTAGRVRNRKMRGQHFGDGFRITETTIPPARALRTQPSGHCGDHRRRNSHRSRHRSRHCHAACWCQDLQACGPQIKRRQVPDCIGPRGARCDGEHLRLFQSRGFQLISRLRRLVSSRDIQFQKSRPSSARWAVENIWVQLVRAVDRRA